MDGHPPIGWANAGCYLVLPVLLVASQYLSMKIVSPPQNKDDPAMQQSQAILKFLPLMIGALHGVWEGKPAGNLAVGWDSWQVQRLRQAAAASVTGSGRTDSGSGGSGSGGSCSQRR